MHNFQSYITSIRESKNLEQKTIADAINLSEETIQTIEEADNNLLLQSSITLLKNQIRKYCEYLEVQERKVISILNKIDVLYYKQSRYGKLKPFDYLNRLLILSIIIAIVILGFQMIQNKISIASSNVNSRESSKSLIIYTPINYEIDNNGNSQDTTVNDYTNNSDSLTTTMEKKELIVYPPPTTSVNNITVDEPNDK